MDFSDTSMFFLRRVMFFVRHLYVLFDTPMGFILGMDAFFFEGAPCGTTKSCGRRIPARSRQDPQAPAKSGHLANLGLCQASCILQPAAWPSGMILAQGARGPGPNSRSSPFQRMIARLVHTHWLWFPSTDKPHTLTNHCATPLSELLGGSDCLDFSVCGVLDHCTNLCKIFVPKLALFSIPLAASHCASAALQSTQP